MWGCSLRKHAPGSASAAAGIGAGRVAAEGLEDRQDVVHVHVAVAAAGVKVGRREGRRIGEPVEDEEDVVDVDDAEVAITSPYRRQAKVPAHTPPEQASSIVQPSPSLQETVLFTISTALILDVIHTGARPI